MRAAIERVRMEAPDLPSVVCGWSFGANVALRDTVIVTATVGAVELSERLAAATAGAWIENGNGSNPNAIFYTSRSALP